MVVMALVSTRPGADEVLRRESNTGAGQWNNGLLALMERTGYILQQRNGQRIFGPPSNWGIFPPQKGCEVFIGKLPRNVYEDELFPPFSRVGVITQIRLVTDFSGTNKGFAFIQFKSPEEADTAVAILNNYEIRPKIHIKVIKSIDNRRLYIGNIPKSKSKAELTKFFQEEVEGIVDVILYQSSANQSLNRGYVFLEFRSHSEAVCGRRKLRINNRMQGNHLTVDWAVPEPQVPDHIMKKVKILYVRNLLLSTLECTIWEAMAFVAGNEVVKVKKIYDFAFVHFATRDKAQAALNFWNNRNLDGSVIEVTWAKPQPKIVNKPHKSASHVNLTQAVVPSECTGPVIFPPIMECYKRNCFLCNYSMYISQACLSFSNTEINFSPTVSHNIVQETTGHYFNGHIAYPIT